MCNRFLFEFAHRPTEPVSNPASAKGAAQGQGTVTVTATCKDGTAFTGSKRSGACRGHGGVQSWGEAGESSGLVTSATEPASAKGAAPGQGTGAVTATCKDGTAFTGSKRSGACRGHGGVQSWGEAGESSGPVTPATEPASVNTDSNVYHCPGTRWYGKTKQGIYMSEAQAQAQGARPDHGKACSS